MAVLRSSRRVGARLAAAALTLLALAVAPAARSGEVVIEHSGLDLTGNLELAAAKTLAADGVVLLLHGTLAHHRMEIIAGLQAALKSRGVNSLAVTLSLGLDRRRGMFDCKLEHDHRHADAVEELEAWVKWLKEQGAARIVLAGHSRGAAQVAAFAVDKTEAGVARLVLIAPPSGEPGDIAAGYLRAFKSELAPVLARAKELVDAGEGDTLLESVDFLSCPKARVTAAAFVDYHAPEERLQTKALVAALKVPVLIIAGSRDEVVPGLAAAARTWGAAATVAVAEIDGADHFFRDLYLDDLADRVAAFVAGR